MPDFFTRQQTFSASAAKNALDRKFKSQLSRKAKIQMQVSANERVNEANRSAAAAFSDITKALGSGVDKAYNVIFNDFVNEAFDAWPVRTGYSKSQFDLLYDTRGDILSAQFINRAPYSKFIQQPLPPSQKTTKAKRSRWGNKKRVIGNGVNVMRKEIFLPSEAVGKMMADAIEASGGIGGN